MPESRLTDSAPSIPVLPVASMLNALRDRLIGQTSADAARGLPIRRAMLQLHSCLKASDILRMEAALLAFERALAENAPRLAVDRTRAALLGFIDTLLRPRAIGPD